MVELWTIECIRPYLARNIEHKQRVPVLLGIASMETNSHTQPLCWGSTYSLNKREVAWDASMEIDSNWRLRLILPGRLSDNLQTNKQTDIYTNTRNIYRFEGGRSKKLFTPSYVFYPRGRKVSMPIIFQTLIIETLLNNRRKFHESIIIDTVWS